MTQATGIFLTGGPTAALPTQQRQRRGVLAPVIALVALGICGLIVLGLVGTSVGMGGVVVGALCALLPVGPVVAAFLWVDRWEPEPPRLLLIAFLWGACFAALAALIINSSAALAVDVLLGKGSGDVIGTSVIAPLVEEGLEGRVPRRPADLPPPRVRRDHRRHRLRRDRRGGLRVHREHPLLRARVRRRGPVMGGSVLFTG